MKTTVEIPDAIFRRAKSAAARQGISLKEFLTDAVKQKLRGTSVISREPTRREPAQGEPAQREPAWIRAFGGLRDLGDENKRIARAIEEEFETIDEEDWR